MFSDYIGVLAMELGENRADGRHALISADCNQKPRKVVQFDFWSFRGRVPKFSERTGAFDDKPLAEKMEYTVQCAAIWRN
ncbi:MAG: hypothetical protein ACI861_002186 [Paracoccaceae bacterium]